MKDASFHLQMFTKKEKCFLPAAFTLFKTERKQ